MGRAEPFGDLNLGEALLGAEFGQAKAGEDRLRLSLDAGSSLRIGVERGGEVVELLSSSDSWVGSFFAEFSEVFVVESVRFRDRALVPGRPFVRLVAAHEEDRGPARIERKQDA